MEPLEADPYLKATKTSRVFVKGLPKHITDDKLREHFSEKGEVTDAKVLKTRDGQSRQIGFVGFRTADQAGEAIKYFNRSFVGALKISVEFAQKVGSHDLSRPWSKHSEGSSAKLKLEAKKAQAEKGLDGLKPVKEEPKKKKKGDRKPLPEEEDPKLAEFLQVMQPRRAARLFSNDDAELDLGGRPAKRARPAKAAAAAGGEDAAEGDGSDGEYEDLADAAAPRRKKGRAMKDDDVETDGEGAGLSEGEHFEDEPRGPVSDLDYLKSRVKSDFDDDDDAWAARGAAATAGDSDDEESSDDDSGSDDGDGDAAPAAAAAAVGPPERSRRAVPAPTKRSEVDEIFASGGAGGDWDADADGSDDEAAAADDDGDVFAGDENPARKRRRTGVDNDEDGTVRVDDHPAISDTGRIFARNLPFLAREEDLSELFAKFGTVSEVHLVLDRATKQSRGIAYIQYADPEDAVRAHAELDGSSFMGRLLHLLPADRPPPPPNSLEEREEKSASFKAEREAARKAGAGNRATWNSLFVRPDTISAAAAALLGVRQEDLLDRDAGDLPVRQALAETQVIASTKKALAEAGVSVDALERAAAAGGQAAGQKVVARSSSALLVKNLPYACTEEELLALFGRCGTLCRLVLPATRALALIEFDEAQDARTAWKTLAFKRFHDAPLYLEWAPKDIFEPDAPKQVLVAPKVASEEAPAAVKASHDDAAVLSALAETADDEGESCTLFVKGLPFEADDARLTKHFTAAVSAAGGTVRSVKVAKKKGPDGKPLSAGFGFVECSSEEVAKAVQKKLQGSNMDGKRLTLQLSQNTPSANQKSAVQKPKAEDGQGTKLVVRNVAFEATRKDIVSLFSPFGQIKSCRLPQKFDGTPRGFAFVEFLTKQEAKSAVEAVTGAHLYGRRLVMEWAKGDESLDDMREKTAAKFRQ